MYFAGKLAYLIVRASNKLAVKTFNEFLARRDECPESYCRTPGVGVGVGMRVRVHKNFNLAYNS